MLSYVERKPTAPLAPFVECLWSVTDRHASARRDPDRIVPDGCPELIFHLADPFRRKAGSRWIVQPRAFLIGTLTRPLWVRAGRQVATLGIRLRPGAAPRLLPVSMAEARDREVPLALLLGRGPTLRLFRGLLAARPAERFASLEALLLARLPARDPAAAIRTFVETQGQTRVDAVARQLGFTRRRLQRLFQRDVGISPKLFARIVRLNAVLADLDQAERARTVELALEAGYFDQAHLLRDFRTLAGRSPRAAREADGPLARHFTDPARLRVLLRGE